jgi:hypothetical protein
MSSVSSSTSSSVQYDSSAPECRDDENYSDDDKNAIENHGDSINENGQVEQSGTDTINITADPPPLEAPDPGAFFSSSPLDGPLTGSDGGYGGGGGITPTNGADGVDNSPPPTVSPDATIPEPLKPKGSLTSVMDGYRQANGQPVVGVSVQATVAVPLSPFGFGGGASGSVGVVFDRFGGVGITMGGSAMAGWGANVSVGVNPTVSTSGTIYGNHDTWQSSGGVSVALGPVGGDFQSGQMGSGLGIGVGFGGGAWATENTQTVIPIIEPTLIFVNGQLLEPGR